MVSEQPKPVIFGVPKYHHFESFELFHTSLSEMNSTRYGGRRCLQALPEWRLVVPHAAYTTTQAPNTTSVAAIRSAYSRLVFQRSQRGLDEPFQTIQY